jgi:hypothetical protein
VGKKSLPCANAKNARQSLCLPCANAKTHCKHFFGRAFFFRRASLKKRTAKHLFAVRLKNTHGKHLGARQIWSFQ